MFQWSQQNFFNVELQRNETHLNSIENGIRQRKKKHADSNDDADLFSLCKYGLQVSN